MSPLRLVSRFQAPAAILRWGGLFVASVLSLQAAAPTAVLLSSNTLMENCPLNTVVGTLTAVDVDVGESHTFELVSGTGSSDNMGFVIWGNQLVAPYGISIEGVVVDFETDPRTFSIRVKTKDAALNAYEQVLIIHMTDDRTEDGDGDGLTEAQEEDTYGTSDAVYDTDMDGVGDGIEVAASTSATNGSVWPANAVLAWGDEHIQELRGAVDSDTLSIVTGQNYSLILQNNGTVRTSEGLNFFGQTTVPSGLTNVTAVAAGGDFWIGDSAFSLALKSDGTLVTWGCNTSGQRDIPVGLSGVIAISAGRVHGLALKGDGTVSAWGGNDFGQSTVPAGLSNVIAVAAGGYHSLALKTDGSVVAWGSNFNGEIWEPVTAPAGLSDVVAISAGRFHSLALRSDGTVVAWGYNLNGQASVPGGLSGVTAVSAGGFHSLALKSDGSVVAWGMNGKGQALVPPSAQDHVKLISAGILHNFALRRSNLFPEITSSAFISAAPGVVVSHQIVVANATPTQFSATGLPAGLSINPTNGLISGEAMAAARKSVGIRVVTDKGVLTQVMWVGISSGVSPTDIALSPQAVTENRPDGSLVGTLSATDPDSGDSHTYELIAGTGSVDNARFRIFGNQLLVNQKLDRDFETNPGAFSVRIRVRDGSLNPFEKSLSIQFLDDRSEDADADGLTEAQEEDINQTSDLLYDTDGDGFGDGYEVAHGTSPSAAASFPTGTLLVAWGSNDNGQTNIPANVGNVTNLAAGWGHSLALRDDGTVVAWGRNSEGQTVVPGGLSGIVAIAAGDFHSMALRSNGTVAAWGGNTDGQTTVPPELTDVIAIAAGSYHSLALKRNGTVVAWGYNDFGQVTVPGGLTNVVSIAAGAFHNLALKSDGTVIAWGSNWTGATTIPSGLSRVVDISAGAYHSIALKYDGTVTVWGDSSSGQGFLAASAGDGIGISAGWLHSALLKSDGLPTLWGSNDNGQTNVPLEARNLKLLVAGDFHNLALRQSTGFPEITNHAPVLAWPGDVVSHQIVVTGATPSHFEAMGLPAGLSIHPTTGLISGTVVTGGRAAVRIMADTNKGSLGRVLWIDTADGHPPTNMALTSGPVTENSPVSTVVGTFSATDPDAGDTHTYQLISDGTNTDNRYFLVSGNQLVVGPGFDRDFETYPANLSIRVVVTDSALNTFVKLFTIPFLDDRTEDADGDGFSEALEEDVLHTSDSIFGDYATTDADGDGVPPLIEYAFNLSTTAADGHVRLGGAGSTVGLPATSFVADGLGHKKLRIEYLRRIGSGLTYTPQFSSGLSAADWQAATQAVQITPINGSWERCLIEDSQFTPGSAKRFGRIAVKP